MPPIIPQPLEDNEQSRLAFAHGMVNRIKERFGDRATPHVDHHGNCVFYSIRSKGKGSDGYEISFNPIYILLATDYRIYVTGRAPMKRGHASDQAYLKSLYAGCMLNIDVAVPDSIEQVLQELDKHTDLEFEEGKSHLCLPPNCPRS